MRSINEKGILELRGHTLVDISDVSILLKVQEELQMLFDGSSVYMSTDVGDDKIRNIPITLLDRQQIEFTYATGFATLTDEKENLYRLSILWQRVSTIDAQAFAARNGYLQNIIYLAIDPDLVADASFRTRYITFCKNISVLLSTTFLYSYHRHNSNTNYDSKLGIGIGLLDIYWINVFGKTYIDLIGKARMLSAPAADVEMLENESVFLQSTKEFLDPTTKDFTNASTSIKEHIGGEYFCSSLDDQELPPSGSISVIGLVKNFIRSHRVFNQTDHRAKRCPDFDWMNTFPYDTTK